VHGLHISVVGAAKKQSPEGCDELTKLDILPDSLLPYPAAFELPYGSFAEHLIFEIASLTVQTLIVSCRRCNLNDSV